MKNMSLWLFVLWSLTGCGQTDPSPSGTSLYFPPRSDAAWETTSPTELGWNTGAISGLKTFLTQTNTKSFMILVNGRIVMEEYFNGHTATTEWEWNSAGKTLVSAITGIAGQENLLNPDNKASDYLGTGWTSMPLEKENRITVRHLLTMTSGIDDTKQLMIRSNLTYVADAGTRWAYSNVFQKLTDVVAKAADTGFETYFNEKLKNKIGMDGYWSFGPIFTIYHSSTRSMARFGLWALNKGKWGDQSVINEAYFTESTRTSQDLNPAYGYLWWLNGKTKFMVPNSQTVFTGFLIPNAPADMYAAMGARDQRIYVIPGRNMVVVRMGSSSNPDSPDFAVSGFDADFWEKINAVIN